MSVPPMPKSPITLLGEGIAASRWLKDVKVQTGAVNLARQLPPPRIVLVPTSGDIVDSLNNAMTCDVKQNVVARIWGRSDDEAWYLLRCFLQAMQECATNGGASWDATKVDWDSEPDTSTQGQAVNVTVVPTLAVVPVNETTTVEILAVNQNITNE